MSKEFAPKDAETLKSEVLEDLGVEYEGNEEQVDKVIARRLKDEEFKASIHKDKMDTREKLKETRKLAGLDPETGEKIVSKETEKPKGGDTTPKNELSLKDIRALQDVHDDDVDQVTDYAKFKSISVAEAKKDPVIQSFLKTKTEERKIAEATNVAGAKKGVSSKNPSELAQKFYENDENLTEEQRVEVVRARLNSLRRK